MPWALWLAALGAVAVAARYPGLRSGPGSSVGPKQILAAAGGLMLALHAWTLRRPDGWAAHDAWWGAPARVRALDALRYTAVVAQLLVILLVIERFQIENQAFGGIVAVLACGGFALHALVPKQHRLTFFVALSLGGLWAVFGARDALSMLGIGLALIGICHLPTSFRVRVLLLLGAGALLALMRVGRLPGPGSTAVWPILGSMFMFRLIVYVYDLRHAEEPARPASTLAYFFLLPNSVFPLFPVVDYTTFRKTYYDAESFEIYQRGVRWIVRGVIQLIVYRLIYQYGTIPPDEVHSVGQLLRYLGANFGLYIRVSGQFHLVTGLLHLFGFHLPPTHNRYFLASNITDFWRRINIYWKDFMQKVVFYPTYFRLKKHGEKTALAIGTVLVFAVTWALHSFQWFWLLGRFPITGPDLAFWGTLAGLMVWSTLREATHGRVRTLAPKKRTLRTMVPLALKTAGTFALICVLWSLWTSPTLADWAALLDLRGGVSR